MSKEVSTDENVPMVTLVSLDEQRFTLPIAAAKESKMVFNALGSDDDSSELMEQDEVNEVDCLKVTGACLEQVVKFLNHQHSIERMKRIIMPLRGNTFDECMKQEWYRNFVNELEIDMIYKLMAAANYMDINPLMELACLRVTFELSKKSAEEIIDYLGLPKNPTPEEEARARQEYAWIFDERNHDRAAEEEAAAAAAEAAAGGVI